MKTVLVASATKPNDFEAFLRCIKEFAADVEVTVEAALVVPGPGCNNYAFRVEGDETKIENFGNGLAMALMPAKWSYAHEELEVGTWINQLET